ncbi:Sporulation/nuclear morphology Spo7 [Penicillium chermesinum]|nr:Sporulation/nuclear morphology Spo7 [Penicillium chermesinum]
MVSPIDQLVKGAAPENRAPAPEPLVSSPTPDRPSTPDPLAALPSSPPQIYLNLLILEASLRAQYLALRERRRQNTFFLLLLAAWITYFSYALFLRPREDGRGVGGSVYWMVEMGEKVALLGGVVTALLVWGTGQWERGIRWPRRWLAVANRGLRTMNTKIIIIRGPWWQELLSYVSFLFPFSLPFSPLLQGTSITSSVIRPKGVVVGRTTSNITMEDLSPGGDYIRLLLLPKSFSPEFRENWDDYRTEFWEKENERRTQLYHKLRERERHLARTEGGWLSRLGIGWRTTQRRRLVAHRSLDSEHKSHHHQQHHPSISSRLSQEHRASSVRRSTRSESSHSRTSSRSSTPANLEDRPPSRSGPTGRPRRSSTAQSASGPEQTPQQQRKRKGSKSLRRGLSPLTQAQIREGVRTPVVFVR